MMRVDFQGLLETLDGIVISSFAGSDDGQVIPRIGQRARLAGLQFQRALKHLAGSGILVLIQVDAADPIQRLGA